MPRASTIGMDAPSDGPGRGAVVAAGTLDRHRTTTCGSGAEDRLTAQRTRYLPGVHRPTGTGITCGPVRYDLWRMASPTC